MTQFVCFSNEGLSLAFSLNLVLSDENPNRQQFFPNLFSNDQTTSIITYARVHFSLKIVDHLLHLFHLIFFASTLLANDSDSQWLDRTDFLIDIDFIIVVAITGWRNGDEEDKMGETGITEVGWPFWERNELYNKL